jgi:hypothetical protein
MSARLLSGAAPCDACDAGSLEDSAEITGSPPSPAPAPGAAVPGRTAAVLTAARALLISRGRAELVARVLDQVETGGELTDETAGDNHA